MAEPSLSVDQHLLEWIRERIAETQETGSICLGIERCRLTWVNHQQSSQLKPPPNSSAGPQSCSASMN